MDEKVSKTGGRDDKLQLPLLRSSLRTSTSFLEMKNSRFEEIIFFKTEREIKMRKIESPRRRLTQRKIDHVKD